jgi:hypothetical protein
MRILLVDDHEVAARAFADCSRPSPTCRSRRRLRVRRRLISTGANGPILWFSISTSLGRAASNCKPIAKAEAKEPALTQTAQGTHNHSLRP